MFIASSKISSVIIISLYLLAYSALSHAENDLNNKAQIDSFSCDPACQNKLQNIIDQFRNKNHIVGMEVSISLPNKDGSLQATQTFNSGHIAKDSNIDIGSINNQGALINIMGIGSITKSFTAAIILQLEAEGKLNLNDTLNMYFPQYPDWKNVTIKQLLNMTSGIYDYEDHCDEFTQQMLADPYRQWLPEELMDISYQNKQNTQACPHGGNSCFSPGTNWYYSNANYMLLGMIINKVTGYDFEHELDSRLLGNTSILNELDNTFYASLPYPTDLMDRLVHQYDKAFPMEDVTYINLSWDGPSGAILSNTEDIIHWVRLLFQSNRVLPTEQSTELTTLVCADESHPNMLGKPIDQPTKDCTIGYGMGIMQAYTENNGIITWYIGGDPGVSSAYVLYNKYNVVIALQYDNDANYGELINNISKIIGIPVNDS